MHTPSSPGRSAYRRLLPALWIATLAFAATSASADDKSYALRFDPIALNLEVGQTGTFTINYTRDGQARFSAPGDYKIQVRSNETGATLRIEGGGFAFVAARPGVYEIYAQHDSTRAWYGARGSMFVRVSEAARPRPGVFPAILLHAADGGALIDPARELELVPGQPLNLRAEHLDAAGRLVPGVLRWTIEPAGFARITDAGRGAVTLVAEEGPDGRHARLTIEVPGTALRREQTLSAAGRGHGHGHGSGPAHARGAARIDLLHGESGGPVGNGPHVLVPGERLSIAASAYEANGAELPRWVPRWEMGREVGALEIDGARVVVVAGSTPGRGTLFATCPISGLRRELAIEVRGNEVPHTGQIARIAIVDGATGQMLNGEQVFRPGIQLTLRAIGLDRRGQPVGLSDVTWTISSNRAGRLWMIDAVTVRLDTSRGPTNEVHEIVARIDDRLTDRLRFRVGEVAVPVPPSPILARVAVVAQLGQGWVELDLTKPLLVPRGARLELRVVGYDSAGREVNVTARWESPVDGLEAQGPAAVRVARLPSGTGALLVAHVSGTEQHVALWVLMP